MRETEERPRKSKRDDGRSPRREADEHAPRPKRGGGSRSTRAIEAAIRELTALTGRPLEGIVGFARTEEGSRITLDLLELEKVPATTDILATYVVELDEEEELLNYRRLRRYVRGRAEGDR